MNSYEKMNRKDKMNGNHKLTIPNMRKQNGAVLIVSLILLIMMTIYGLTSMNTSLLQEKMSTNAANSNRAFQAAESAIGAIMEDVMVDGDQSRLAEAMAAASGQSDVVAYAVNDPQVTAAYLVRYRGEITVLSGNSLDADESSTILRGQRFELVGTGNIEGSNAQSIIRQGAEYR